MPDSVHPIPVCPQNEREHTVTTTDTGYGPTRREAVDDARDRADRMGALLPTCPGDCVDAATETEPPFDGSAPAYEVYGTGYKCSVSRIRKVKLRCTQSSSTGGGEHSAVRGKG